VSTAARPPRRQRPGTPAAGSPAGAWLLRAVGVLLLFSALAIAFFRAPDRPVDTLVARWAPPPSDFIELQGQLVHLRDVGPRDDPVPIVLVHGTSASLHTWEAWALALQAKRRVISFDLPGFGLTGPSPQADYRPDTQTRFVLDLLDALKVQRFAMVGNSMGGEIAWRAALMAPARVDRLVLIAPAGHAFEPQQVPLGWLIARIPVINRIGESLLPRALVAQGLVSVYGDPAQVTPELVDRYFEMTLREGNRRALSQRLQQVERGADAGRIASVAVPTLILWGGRDRVIPPAIGERFERDIAGSRRIVFDTLGHVPHEEDPAATLAVAKPFLGVR
jgi:pimeloyl-ACP methyl ester carboxylesterase